MTSNLPFVALIGCGEWGKNSARTLHKLGALGGIVDAPTALKAVSLSQELNVPFMDLETCLSTPLIQGVVIATPTPTHFSIAKRALEQGKHVFVEKPLASTIEEAQALQGLAAQSSLTLMVGHLLRYHPAFNKLLEWCHSEKLGDLIYIQTYRMNLGKIHPHESVGWDLGPHDLSMVLAIMEGHPLLRLFSTSLSYFKQGIGDIETLILEFEKGVKAQINLSRLHPSKEQKIIVGGTKGIAVFDDTKPWPEKLVLYKDYIKAESPQIHLSKENREYALLDPAEPLKIELTHFLNCIKNQTLPLTRTEEGLEVIKILTLSNKSQRGKCWIKINA